MILAATAADYADLIAGRGPRALALPDTEIAPPAVLQMLADVAATVRTTFAPASWLIVADGEVVGLCAVTRPPEAGSIDIGYGIAASRQRWGHATQAVAAIAEWARQSDAVCTITAETSVSNPASQHVLSSNGFTQSGERHDADDGALLCWQLPV